MGVIECRRAIIAGQDGFIPPEYQKVDYLQTTGYKARFDTGVPGNDDTLKISGDIGFVEYRQYHYFFGNRGSSAQNYWGAIMPSSTNATWFSFYCNSTGDIAANNLPNTTWKNPFRITFSLEKNYIEWSIHGSVSGTRSATPATGSENSTNITIGGSSVNVSESTYTTKSKLFWFKIMSHGKLIRNYIPVVRKSDNKAGFYDTVNCTFNPSIGTAEFVAGNET